MSPQDWGWAYPPGAAADRRAPWNEVEVICPECESGDIKTDPTGFYPKRGQNECLSCWCLFTDEGDVLRTPEEGQAERAVEEAEARAER